VRRERRQPTRAEWERVTSRRPVVRRIPPRSLGSWVAAWSRGEGRKLWPDVPV
jgi:hypothetical protein